MYFKYHLASKNYAPRTYGSQTELYESEQVVHVAGPYKLLGDAQKSLNIELAHGLGASPKCSPDASKGHVTLSGTPANNYQKPKQLVSIGRRTSQQ